MSDEEVPDDDAPSEMNLFRTSLLAFVLFVVAVVYMLVTSNFD